MRHILGLFVAIFLLLGKPIHAQIEQINNGANYSQQVYYKLSDGSMTEVPNDSWDIAFTSFGLQDAGVLINESSDLGGNAIRLFLAPTNNWEDPIVDLSPYIDTLSLSNTERAWTEGAFNVVRDPSDFFDYGWGAYNQVLQQVEGTKVYVVKLRDNSFLKMQITALDFTGYHFRYANLDGSNEQEATIVKDPTFGGLKYFTFSDGTEVQMPQDYDLVFQRYSTVLDAGAGTTIVYPVLGALLAPGVEAVVAHEVDPVNVSYNDYENKLTDSINAIGSQWKIYDFTAGWIVDDARAQFIKTQDDKIYKLVFYDFSGSAAGITTLERTFIQTVGIEILEEVPAEFLLSPNPSSTEVYMHQLSTEVQVQLMNAQGQTLRTELLNPSKRSMDVSDLPSGLYHLLMHAEDQYFMQRLLVQ